MSIPRVRLGRLGTIPDWYCLIMYSLPRVGNLTAKFCVIDLVKKMADISVLRHTESKTGIDCVRRAFIHLLFVQSPDLSVLNNAGFKIIDNFYLPLISILTDLSLFF